MNQALRQELLALAEQEHAFLGAPEHDWDSDQVQRQLLELMGRITQRLVEILDTYGWPGKSLVGDDGLEAAWTLALHTMHGQNPWSSRWRAGVDPVVQGTTPSAAE